MYNNSMGIGISMDMIMSMDIGIGIYTSINIRLIARELSLLVPSGPNKSERRII